MRFGDEDGEDAYLFYRVADIASLSDGRVAVLNSGSHEVRLFDAEGSWLYSFGQDGEAPGELNQPRNMWVSNDLIRVGDFSPWHYDVFQVDGTPIETVVIEQVSSTPGVSALFADGRSVVAELNIFGGTEFDFSPTTQELLLYDAQGTFIDTVTVLPGSSYGQLDDSAPVILNPTFEPFSSIDGESDQLVIGWGGKSEYSVYDIDAYERPEMIVRWATARDRTVRDEDVRAYYDESRVGMTESNRQFVEQLTHPERPVMDLFPAFRSVQLGLDHRVWVSRYERPGEDDSNAWLVFNADGLFECHVDLPLDFNPYEFGPDYVLGRNRDDLGVESIVKWGLSRP